MMKINSSPPPMKTCFVEENANLALSRRSAAEGIGTFLLVIVLAGSALTGERLAPNNPAIILLVSALGTSGALVGLILAFGKVSGGHFNPLITGLQWLFKERDLKCTLAYVFAQFLGAALGAMLIDVAFMPACCLSPHVKPQLSATLFSSEVFASAALMIIIFGCSRSNLATVGPVAVGGWLFGAIIATPSTSYANPSITLAAIIVADPFGLSAATAIAFVGAQIAGSFLAYFAVAFLYPRTRSA